MKIAIVGSRDYKFPKKIIDYIDNLPKDTEIVSGGARGVDTIAEVHAREIGLKVKVFPAEWKKFGLSAGYKRNFLIIQEADRVVAFWDGESKGTAHSISLAKKMNKPLEVIE